MNNAMTEIVPTASANSTPIFRSTATIPGATGTTINTSKPGTTIKTGARKWVNLSAARGTMSSFNSIFNPSANGWRMPNGPTRFGPYRF